MTRKPNFWKCILGVVVLAALFIGVVAVTRAPKTSAKATITVSTKHKAANSGSSWISSLLPQSACGPLIPQAVCNTFEIEGNAADDSPGGLPDDWNDDISSATANGVGPQGSVSGPPDAPGLAITRTFVNDIGGIDRIYTQGGSKDFNDIGDWRNSVGSVPDKDEITHGGAAKYHDAATGHDILAFFGDRFDNSGDANIGFWFFQNEVSVNTANGTFTGVHENGDIFVLSAFSKGGGTSTVRVLKWVGTPANTAASVCSAAGGVIDPKSDTPAFPQGSLCDITGATIGGQSPGTGIVNGGPITVNWSYSQKGGAACASGPCSIPQKGLFYEGAIDLTALGLAGECFASFLLETRSSADVSAVLKDFSLGGFQKCNTECSKVASAPSVCAGSLTTYTYTASNPSSPAAITVTLIDDNATASTADDIDVIASNGKTDADVLVANEPGGAQTVVIQPGETKTYTRSVHLQPGTYHNTLTVHATNPVGIDDCTSSADVTVNPNPTVTVNSPTVCASNLPATITASPSPAGTYTYVWTVPAGASDPGNVASFSATVPGDYSVTVTDGNTCSGSGMGHLTVNNNPTVTVNSPEVCAGDSATITASPQGTGPFHFAWTVPAGATNPGDTASFSASVAGDYSVVVTDATATLCQGSGKGTLTVDQKPVASIATESCSLGNTLTLHASATVGGVACTTCTFLWTRPDNTTASGATLDVTAPGNYSVVASQPHSPAPTCSSPSVSKHVGLCAP